MRHSIFAIPTILAAFLFASSLAAQDAMPVEQLASTAQRLKAKLDRLGEIENPNAEEKKRLAETEKELDDLAEWIERQKGFTEQHYVQAGAPFFETHPRQALRITDAGLKPFPDSRFLNDHRGFALTKIAEDLHPCAAQLAAWHGAEAAFRKSLTCKPETFHAHAGLFQVLDHLDRCDEAMRELDAAMAHEAGKQAVEIHVFHRASMLMRAGKAKDALKLLQAAQVSDEDKVDHLVFLVRAAALANDAAAAQAAIPKLRAADTTPRSLIEAADALAYLGKKADALKLLAQRPPIGKFSNEQERLAQLWSQNGAAMEVFWTASDFSPAGPLRAALTKTLDHHFIVMDGGKQVELNTSPLMMCKLLGDAAKAANERDENIKDWGNHTLFVLCARAAPAHKPAGMEQNLVTMFTKNNDPIPDTNDIPARLLALRWNVGNTGTAGVLTGLRAIEKLEPKKPAAAPAAPAKPPAKK